jgi:hypothetical protein
MPNGSAPLTDTSLDAMFAISGERESHSTVILKYCSMETWTSLSGMSRSRSYDALKAGDLRAKKQGTRLLIDVDHGLAWIASLPDARFGAAKSSHQK